MALLERGALLFLERALGLEFEVPLGAHFRLGSISVLSENYMQLLVRGSEDTD